jgi:hypothetical protein
LTEFGSPSQSVQESAGLGFLYGMLFIPESCQKQTFVSPLPNKDGVKYFWGKWSGRNNIINIFLK